MLASYSVEAVSCTRNIRDREAPPKLLTSFGRRFLAELIKPASELTELSSDSNHSDNAERNSSQLQCNGRHMFHSFTSSVAGLT